MTSPHDEQPGSEALPASERADAPQPTTSPSAEEAAAPEVNEAVGPDGEPQVERVAEDEPVEEVEATDPLSAAQAEIADLADELSRCKADLYNLQQEYNAFVRRSKSQAAEQQQHGSIAVVETLLGVLDEIELARQHGDLTGPPGVIAEKVETTLAQRFGVARYGEAGEDFDPERHDALMSTPDEAATTTTIAEVIQPGYIMGEKVLRAARVAVTSPQ